MTESAVLRIITLIRAHSGGPHARRLFDEVGGVPEGLKASPLAAEVFDVFASIDWEHALPSPEDESPWDDELAGILKVALKMRASGEAVPISVIQRRFGLGYRRARSVSERLAGDVADPAARPSRLAAPIGGGRVGSGRYTRAGECRMGIQLWARKDGKGLRIRCGDRVKVGDGKHSAHFEIVSLAESAVPIRCICAEDDDLDELGDSPDDMLPSGSYALLRLVEAPRPQRGAKKGAARSRKQSR